MRSLVKVSWSGQAGAGASQTPADSPVELAWLYEFNLANAKSSSSKTTSPRETAVDELLATDWT